MTIATAQPMQPATFNMLEDLLDMPVRAGALTPRAPWPTSSTAATSSAGPRHRDHRGNAPGRTRHRRRGGLCGQSTDLLQLARQTPVIRLVNMILFEALRRRASDIHVHPMESKLVIRFRVDGMLVDAFSPPSRSPTPSPRASRS
jgi:hypothetical protein